MNGTPANVSSAAARMSGATCVGTNCGRSSTGVPCQSSGSSRLPKP